MIDIKKVAKQIKDDSLYNTIYYEVKEKLKIDTPSYEEIEILLKDDEYFLQEYRDINRYSELSSIHANKLEILENEQNESKKLKKSINENIQKLKNLENFSVDSKGSAYEIWIGSAGVMVVFMVHNIIALFTELYNTHGTLIYAIFILVLFVTYYAYKKVKDNHEKQHVSYKKLYSFTETLINEAFKNNYIKRNELYS